MAILRIAWVTLALASMPMALAQSGFKLGVEHETSWNSRYIWRGFVVDGSPSIQSDNTIYLGPMWLNVWSIGRTLRPALEMGSDELDVTLGWETALGGISLQPHFIYYSFAPGAGVKDTMEAGLTASTEIGDISVFTNHFLDLRTASGAYYGEVGAAYEKEIGGSWSAGLTATLGWASRKFNAYNLGVDKRALNAITGELSLTYRLGPVFYIRPYATVNRLLDKGLRNGLGDSGGTVWGIAFGFSG